MSSVLAAFPASFTVDAVDSDGRTEGRARLEADHLALVPEDGEAVTVPLETVYDVTVDSVSSRFDTVKGMPVTIAYRTEDGRATAVVGSDSETIRKFVTVLFKALLNGKSVTVKHPARIGGRVVGTEFTGGMLSIDATSVTIDTDEGPIGIDLDTVVDFSREDRSVTGSETTSLLISHARGGDVLSTIVATESDRVLSLLGRYIRRLYQRVLDSLRNLSLSDAETELLTAIYSTRDADVSLTGVLGTDPKTVKRYLHALHEKGLVESGDGGPALTARGQIVVTKYIERVNA